MTVQYVSHRTAKELAEVIKNVIKLYSRAGFICQTALMDGEFEKVKDKLLDKIVVNICLKNEHVPKIKRKIRHNKECCRCIMADMPVKVLPNVIIKHLVLHATMFLNEYPDPQGLSQELSLGDHPSLEPQCSHPLPCSIQFPVPTWFHNESV